MRVLSLGWLIDSRCEQEQDGITAACVFRGNVEPRSPAGKKWIYQAAETHSR